MAFIFALINKETLNFICKGKGVTVDFLAQRSTFSVDKIKMWLDVNNKSFPTINQAKKIAACLHIPFAALYMDFKDIPMKEIPNYKNMRTIMNVAYLDDSAINIAIMDVITAFDYMSEINNEVGISSQPYIEALMINSHNSCVWAKEIRKYLNLGLDEQFKLDSARKFYLFLRSRVEAKGIFVHGFNGVPIETARGFAIFYKQHPIIGLNDEDYYPAKSFSIIHELVHIIKRESSLCNDNYNSFGVLSEEIFCNAVAGEVLVPGIALNILLKNDTYQKPYTIKDIRNLAEKFSVSKEVIVRRLLDNYYIDKNDYDTYNDLIKIEKEKQREENKIKRQNGTGGSYSRDMSIAAIDRTSPSICKALYLGYASDIYSKNDLSNYLGIKLDKIDRFLKGVAQWNS